MPRMDGPARTLASAYDSASDGCLIVEHDPPGALTARGSGVLDLLQRMSTNDLTGLAAGRRRGTVLTSAIGRIVDVIEVVPGPDEWLILTSPGRAGRVLEWLRRYIFFQDDVALAQSDVGYRHWGFYGPLAESEAAALSGASIDSSREAVLRIGGSLAWRVEKLLPGVRLIADPAMHEQALARWDARGVGSPERQAFDALRIEHGLPDAGREFEDGVIPLEVDLWDLVSFEKGCYIGQEVIARMESRGQVARRLVGVELAAIVPPPQEVLRSGAVIGRLTSVARSPRRGPIGLALVRASAIEPDRQPVTLNPSGAAGVLRSLPF